MASIRGAKGALAAGLAWALAGCATTQLQAPPAFEAVATVFPVEGHSPRRDGQPLRIGPHRATAVRDGGTFGWQLPAGALDVGGRTRDYAFTLVAPAGPPVEVQCRVADLSLGHDDRHGRVLLDPLLDEAQQAWFAAAAAALLLLGDDAEA